MEAQKWLEHVKKLDELIKAKIEECERLKEMATSITPMAMDGMPFSNTGTVSQPIQDAVIKLIMLADETNKLVDEYVDHKQKVVAVLETLPEREYGVLHRYYIRYMTWEQVAEDMNYSTQQIWRIKKKGLQLLEDVIVCYT